MGNADRLIRLSVAALVLILFFTKVITGTLAVVLLIFAGVFVLTSLVGFCPLYLPLGIKTMKKPSK